PRGVSIATAISLGDAPVVCCSQAQSSFSAAPSCLTSRSRTRLPSESSRQTQWFLLAQSIPTNQRGSFIVLLHVLRAVATLVGPCTGALGASSYWTSSRPRRRGTGPTQVLWAQAEWGAPGGLARGGSLIKTGARTSRRVQGGIASCPPKPAFGGRRKRIPPSARPA